MAQKEAFLRTKHVLDKRLCQRVRQDIEDIRLADTFVQKHNQRRGSFLVQRFQYITYMFCPEPVLAKCSVFSRLQNGVNIN